MTAESAGICVSTAKYREVSSTGYQKSDQHRATDRCVLNRSSTANVF